MHCNKTIKTHKFYLFKAMADMGCVCETSNAVMTFFILPQKGGKKTNLVQ